MSATATHSRRRIARRALHESAPLKGRVDRAKGIVFDVQIVGRKSPNTHGVAGVDGTDYTTQALESELAAIERDHPGGINVNVNHPERSGPPKDRSAYDRYAWIESPRLTESGIRGNLRFLDPTDSLAVRVMNAAEWHPEAFALSHNAYGQGEVKDGRYVVTHVPEVRSIDLVADGGTNRSLLENHQRGRTVTTTLKKLIESSKAKSSVKAKLLEMGALCEDDPAGGPMMDAPMEAPEPAGEESGDWKEHLTNAIGALVQDESPENHAKAMAIMKILGPDKPKEKKVEEADDEPEEKDGEDKEEKKEKKTEEANRRNRSLCKLAGVEADTELLESLATLSTEAASNLLARLKTSKPASGVRSAPAGSVRVTESKADKFIAPKTAAEQAALLKRGA